MTTLGEAFIAVHADMSPFRREIGNNAKKDLDVLEEAYGPKLAKIVSDAISDGAEQGGKEGGKKASKGLGDGIKDGVGDKNKSPWIAVTGALASALEDGISALPAELKAAILIGLVAVAPIIIAGLTGAISAGISAGVLGLGVALATQFQAVQNRWQSFQSSMRNTFVAAAAPLVQPILEVLDQAEERFGQWGPRLEKIFDSVGKGLDPLVNAILDGLEYLIDVFESNLGNIDTFAQSLADAIWIVTAGLAEMTDIFLSTGEDGAQAFLDLVYVLTSMTVALAEAMALATRLYAAFRDIVEIIPDWAFIVQPLGFLFKGLVREIDAVTDSTQASFYTNLEYIQGVGTVVAATKDEEKALKELKNAINDANEAAWNAIDSQIAFEDAIDSITESIRENGRTLDIETEKGRNNLRTLGNAIKIVQQQAMERAESGKHTQAELLALYNQEIERIYATAAAQGITRDRVREVYGALIDMLTLPPPNTQWAENLANALGRAAANSQKIKYSGAYGDFDAQGRPLAEGGIVRAPTNALIGEAGTEVVIPMTRPARAAELMRQSGLDRMFGGSGDVSVQVFLGNEAFDQHVQKVVIQDNRAQARQLGFGVR